MHITKAIITSASPNQARLPLQTVVDRGGQVRTALELVLEEIIGAGIEDVAIVICPGTADRYLHAAGDHATRLKFFEQDKPRGYGDALLRAKAFAASEPFLHLVSDHLYVSKTADRAPRNWSKSPNANNVPSQPSNLLAKTNWPSSVPWVVCGASTIRCLRSQYGHRETNANHCRTTTGRSRSTRWPLLVLVRNACAHPDHL